MLIGLTGGIGSGKSSASEIFASLGATVIDADIVSREVVAPGSAALAQITAHFGSQILTPAGTLDRAKLRAIIFASQKEKDWLEQLMHPAIRNEIIRQLKLSTSDITILEAPLLIENGLHHLVDKVVVVDVDESLQIKRAAARDNNSESQIKAIMASQLSRRDRLRHADYILDNNGSLRELINQVEILQQSLSVLSSTAD